MADSQLETLSFTQEELSFLIAVINIALQTGKFSIGDLHLGSQVARKLQEKFIPPKEEKKAEN